ncbi:FAD:protein FMN transferase [Metapseudomonas resinovorans]|uniref:FAD:protein FMN transferase n=1 Tax=Metapseudomonas resinovorans NBRC 106553 TaxID=1245471 RepID=S6AHU3_METRE|nr:FAD:protein FMN transferase [Pseudomonas resinovorans]BAN47865.1 putative thiamine biosynthesis lipoprotein ApbE [Pseudomonas resinovorans NBRC 106553]
MARSLVLLLSASLLLAGCGETLEQFGGPTMGSSYSVKYVRGASGPSVEQARGEVEGILAEIDRQMSTYRNDSEVERFNALPAGSCLALPGPMLELVAFAGQLSKDSDGAFDMTVEPLLNLWGFGPQSRGDQVPSPEAIAAAKAVVGQQHLTVRGQELCKDAPVQLDFNSIAAGYAVDRVVARLGELGVGSALVEITGELKAVGRKPDGMPWRIAIEAPRDDRQVAQKIVQLDGLGVSTSGDYRNYFEKNGKRYSHTIDPKTGAPISHSLAAVTVVDESALRADGLSTLLMVLGPEAGEAYAERQGIAAFFVTRAGEGFVSHGSSRFRELFEQQEKSK